jgi:molybdopterin-guanine dinucleotide biosynthesis protein
MAMRVIITGPSANCGKTALACRIVAATPGAQALKITRFHREEHCPVHGINEQGEDNCDGCDPAPAGFELVTDDAVLRTPGKDTDRLMQAGAAPVLWLRAAPHVFRYALAAAIKHFDEAKPLVVEGNSAATLPEFAGKVVLIWPQRTRGVKASVLPALKRADVLVLVEHEEAPHRRIPNTLRSALARAGMTEQDLPKPHWLPAGWWSNGADLGDVLLGELATARA